MALENVFFGWKEGNEATARSYSAHAPIIVGDDPYTQVSTESITYDGYRPGSVDDIKETVQGMLFEASRLLRIEASATRQAGGTWQITVTRSTYQPSSEAADELPDGEREDAPSYQCSESRADIPLTLHPRYVSLFSDPSSPVALALAALYNGQLGGELVQDPAQEGGYIGTADAIISAAGDALAAELSSMFQRNQKSYVSIQTTLTCSFKTTIYNLTRSSKLGKIADPPGPYQTPSNKNWLCIGVDTQPLPAEGRFSVSEKYLLSDLGGWDNKIYETAT